MSAISPDCIVAAQNDPLEKPVSILLGNGRSGLFKIDVMVKEDGICAIAGWQSEPFELRVAVDAQEVTVLRFARFMRNDVNRHLGTSATILHGFAMAFACDAHKHYRIFAGSKWFVLDLDKATCGLEQRHNCLFGEEIAAFLHSRGGDLNWKKLVESGASPIKCGLDYALRWPEVKLGSPVIVTGWITSPSELDIYAGDNQVYQAPIMHFFHRPDIAKEYDLLINMGPNGYGFISILKDYPMQNDHIAIYVENGGVKARVAELEIKTFYGFRSFLKAIFEIDFASSELTRIYGEALSPLLTEIQQKRFQVIMAANKINGQMGQSAPNPAISVIIPIYGSLEMLETQIQRFAWDQAFHKLTELIYVIADPGLLDQFRIAIPRLYHTYGMACRWIYAQVSLGFAEACNLGAAVAKGEYLFFVNSDVYPTKPGWLQAFKEFLENTPKAGLAGCCLVYPDGSPQHCGAKLQYNCSLNVRECVHLLSDSGDSPRIMPYVTGACIALRKTDFDSVNGFSTEYLIGNYEDLDLCDKLRATGKSIWYLPMISMIHVWHHSFKAIGQCKWLERLAVYNGILFTKKYTNCAV